MLIKNVLQNIGAANGVVPSPAPAYAPNDAAKVNIGLAVESMRRHMTDEGWQIFAGLEHAGYSLYGARLPNCDTNVANIVRLNPKVVVVQDKREWDVSPRDFRDKAACFKNVEELRNRSDIFKITILKDAHQRPDYHKESADGMGAHAWIVYYHPTIVKHVAGYVRPKHLIRTYHTLDKDLVPGFSTKRSGTLISGAVSGAYPWRKKLVTSHKLLRDARVVKHPGYHMSGCQTPVFLRQLNSVKVSICTSSIYGYVLRKVIESVACGCVVITDLPHDEVLPEIDPCLVRVPTDMPIVKLNNLIVRLYDEYDIEKQRMYAEKAKAYYDFRVSGIRLANDIEQLRRRYNGLDK